MPKFFINNSQIHNDNVYIIGEDVNHICNVLRKKTEDKLQVCNLDNSENYIIQIIDFDKDKICGKIIEKIESNAESAVDINIFQGIPKSDKMELIIQKSVELGVKEFTPVSMERCVSKISAKDEKKKIDRWQKISEVAAKQSGRDLIPTVNNIVNIDRICSLIGNFDLVIVPYEKEVQTTFKEIIDVIKQSEISKYSIAIVIGPEGGFESSEIEKLKNSGAKIVTLGERILRTETVALAMVSVIMYELGGSI